jgi:cytochrome c biogenesis protein CcmG, thiol:disulfide interchange protein DsbE
LNRPGSGTLSLLIVAALFAVGVGTYVVLRPPPAPALRIGAIAPEFSLPVEGGGAEISLRSLRGKVVFVNFWATWCTPCRSEAPSLASLHRELRGDDFEIVAISIDDPNAGPAIEQFRRDFSLDFPIALDPTKRVYAEYQAFGVPETFLLDPSGRLLEHFVGPQNWEDPRYSRAIRRALAAAKVDSGGSPGE